MTSRELPEPRRDTSTTWVGRVTRPVVYLAALLCTALVIWALIEGGERDLWSPVSGSIVSVAAATARW